MKLRVVAESVKAGGLWFNIVHGSMHLGRLWCPRPDMISGNNFKKIHITPDTITMDELNALYFLCPTITYNSPKDHMIVIGETADAIV